MAIIIAPTSLDTDLSQLLSDVSTGKIQLPEFQRGWTWDDNRIRGILASLSQGYPMGAIMRLQYGNPAIKFSYRVIEGVKVSGATPDYLVLDGQQRLTSMYRSTHCSDPVDTVNEQKKPLRRFYYLDINQCLNDDADRIEAILSIPDDKKVKANFDRDVVLDLSTRELEYEHEMFPVSILFDSDAREDWADGYKEYYDNDTEHKEKYKRFRKEVLNIMTGYKLPVITLDKDTPREAVCKVFEDVNTGGVPLTVFELVTAMFATYADPATGKGFNLRDDWQRCRDIIRGVGEALNTDIMYDVDESSFLTAVTLYTNYLAPTMTTCKRKDVLSLPFEDYCKNKDRVLEGYKLAHKFLIRQNIFRRRDLPYTSQLIPLSVICALITESVFDQPKVQKILEKWFWCGILGEMYGGSNESRFANDVEDVLNEINEKDSLNRTINAASFSSTRLLSLQSRNSAAYKGIMALLYKAGSRDFILGNLMDPASAMIESPDIHHIFPEVYCSAQNYERQKWNSIVNKTPLLPKSNRAIGGSAPSIYSQRIMKTAEIDEAQLRVIVESNQVDYDLFIRDDFQGYFIDRSKKLLRLIENAMGKTVPDKAAEQTIRLFGSSLE